jgi:hypothetical protein
MAIIAGFASAVDAARPAEQISTAKVFSQALRMMILLDHSVHQHPCWRFVGQT